MDAVEGPEVIKSVDTGKTELLARPTELYRGFIPQKEGDFAQSSSTDILERVITEGLNPHDMSFANNFIWASPDRIVAQKVVASRFLAKMVTDGSYAEAVHSERKGFLPAIATIKVKPETKLYDGEGKIVMPVGQSKSRQIIVDNIGEQDYTVEVLNAGGVKELLDLLNKTDNIDDIVSRATVMLDQATDCDFLKDAGNIDNKSIKEIFRMALEYYQSKGLNREQIEDLLAQSMNGYSHVVGDLARGLKFDAIEKPHI